MDSTPLIEEIGELLAKHKLVPFIGAGISRQHLGFDAAGLAQAMCAELGVREDLYLAQVSDRFVTMRGEAAFAEYLAKMLVTAELDERKAPAHRMLISLMLGLIYTTNQDNLFELTAVQYGRRYRLVVTLDDLSEAVPGEPLLVKFHGDVSTPQSLVFGAESYRRRMAITDHPLDIKLRADLLGKRLLFIGYSLRDENIVKLFDNVQRIFNGNLPPSYLIAFDDDPALLEAAGRYQIKVLVPSRLFPEAKDNSEAFERCMQAICTETRKRQIAAGLDEIGGTFNPAIATEFDVASVEQAVETLSFDKAVELYRMTFDLAEVPRFLRTRVIDLFDALTDRVDPADPTQMDALKAALFNISLPPGDAAVMTAAFMAACNRRPTPNGFDNYTCLACHALPDDLLPIAAAIAVHKLHDREEPVSDAFRELGKRWFEDFDKAPDAHREFIRSMIQIAWPADKAADSPLNQPVTSLLKGKSFHQILADMQATFPKRQARIAE